jgi:cell division protein FtsZ
VRGGAFIAPKPVDPGVPRQVPLAHPAVPPAAAEAPARPRSRGPSLIERVTGVGRVRLTQPTATPAPTPTAAPPAPARPTTAPSGAPRPAQPRLASLEPEEQSASAKEDDLLDIPAFLRRQAN